jgi:Uma2 family endonuclease
MASAPLKRMTVDEFLVWAEAQPEQRFELVHGQPIAMSPERARHAEAKAEIYVALRGAVRQVALPCHVLPDGMTIRIDDQTAFEPDALVYCGARIDGDDVEVPNPVIVVEVLSPASVKYDSGAKLAGYFKVPSIQHYLMVDPAARLIVHHARQDDATILTRIVSEGHLDLTPPGLAVPLSDVFPTP